MNLVYFKQLPLDRLRDWIVFVDYEGTLSLPGANTADDESVAAVLKLKTNSNEVYLCTNRSDVDPRLIEGGITHVKLARPKPEADEALLRIIQGAQKKCLLIGDSLTRDGGLAKRLAIPFMPVQSLGATKGAPFPASVGCPAPFLEIDKRTVTLITKMGSFWGFLGHRESIFEKHKRLYVSDLLFALKQAGTRVIVNPPLSQIEGALLVVGDPSQIETALYAKKRGFCQHLIAGPGLVQSATEATALLEKPEIDAIVLTCETEKSQWANTDQYFNRAVVVETGVHDKGARSITQGVAGRFVVFADNVPEKMFREIMKVLWQKKAQIVVSKSGSFNEHRYQKLLRGAEAVLLLTSEGDFGRMMAQAWMADVPTLVWKNARQESVPANCGESFVNEVDFESSLNALLSRLPTYTPRRYALENKTLERMAAGYLRLMSEL